ncbi:MAG: FtsX-like permease family protein [Candidatus Latescibacterota bacterium]
MFTFPLLAGDAATALCDPSCVVLTEEVARRHFGAEPALGQVLSIRSARWEGEARDFTVSGVLAPVPSNSSLHFGCLVPLQEEERAYLEFWVGLALACANFVNLAVARSAGRAREIGLRKVVGAQRRQVMAQFWGEALLSALCALGLGVALAELLLPAFGQLMQVRLRFDWSAPGTLVALPALALLVGLLAGARPALLLSGFHPVQVLYRRTGARGSGRLRRGLLVFQLALCAFLSLSALLIARQVEFVTSRDLGMAGDQVVFRPAARNDLAGELAWYHNELARHPEIVGVAAAHPGPGFTDWSRSPWERPEGTLTVARYSVSPSFLQTLGIGVVAGRDLQPGDRRGVAVINETLARALGGDPIGRALSGLNVYPRNRLQSSPEPDPVVVGVARDAHFFSLHQEIAPVVFEPTDGEHFLYVRLAKGHIAEALRVLRNADQRFSPGLELEYQFIDDYFAGLYREEQRWGRITGLASGLAILVAAIGLFGLTVLTAQSRTREIGIRKVLGSTVPGVVRLLSREVGTLVVAGNLVAWPAAYFVAERWLERFAYRAEVGPWPFVAVGLATLGIAWLAMGWHTLRAALANPVEAVRQE